MSAQPTGTESAEASPTLLRDPCVICVAAQKGGVGKTATTVNLAAEFARRGASVCVIDLDPKEAPFRHVVTLARTVGKVARGIGLRGFLKTSGATGSMESEPVCWASGPRAQGRKSRAGSWSPALSRRSRLVSWRQSAARSGSPQSEYAKAHSRAWNRVKSCRNKEFGEELTQAIAAGSG